MRRFEIDDIDNASQLLSKRHSGERTAFPSLKAKYEDTNATKKIINKLINEKNCIGVCAYKDSSMIGYIISHVKTDGVFGRCAWVKYEGMAIDENEDSELYRKMYAYIANLWLEAGCLTHYVLVPAGNSNVVNAWLRLGFAYQQVHGIANAERNEVIVPDGITIKTASENDENDLKSISNLIISYQAKSPTFAAGLPEDVSDIKKGYAGLGSDEDATVLLAYDKQKILGFQCGFNEEDDDLSMMVPKNSYEIAVGATVGDSQGLGIGTLLVKMLINKAIDAGVENIYTDWRIANLKSSLFWPNRGFKDVAYRMVRHIDGRVYWADGVKEM